MFEEEEERSFLVVHCIYTNKLKECNIQIF